MLRTILFDLDDTLLDFAAAEASALRHALTELGLPAGDAVLERYHIINRRQWELLEDGVLTREEVLVGRFERLFQELGMDASALEICTRYERYLAQGHDLVPGALELLAELAPRYDLYLASNGTASVQHSRLALSGIGRWFRGIFISEEVGWDKPRPEFFQACFDAIPGFSRETALMVGDSLTSDIRGGIRAGIRTCWFDPTGRPPAPDIQPDYTIGRLADLPPLLETL